MKTEIKNLALTAAAACALLALSTGSAVAGSRIFDNSLVACGFNNCSSLTIPGTVTNAANNNDPFEIQVYARAGECLRLEVTQSLQRVDLEMVVRAPNGSIYRNDDGFGGGVLANPLVKINGVPNSGWYSVSINHWIGTASYADFVMTYGRYNIANMNCSAPTLPFAGIPEKTTKPATSPAAVYTRGVGTIN